MEASRVKGPFAEPSRGSVTPTTVFRYKQHHPLNAIFAPKSVALIGATDKADTVGRTLLWNLISNPFGGTVFPVNPHRASVLGIKAYSNVAALPQQVDLAIIATPAPTVPGIIAECVEAGVKGAIIISAGFKERGAAGTESEQQILEQAHRGKMRIIGPNCLDLIRSRLS
jgi:acetyltransferase